MGNRRRNLLVLAFVVVLTGASLYAISQKRTVLGLDLRGGTELVYQANPTAKNPSIDAADMDRAIDILRERTDELGVSEPEIARIGTDQIEVGLPDVSNAQRAIEQVGTTAQLFLYDYERNLIARDPELSEEQQAFGRLFDAVEFAAKQKPECFQDLCSTRGSQYYLFDASTLALESGPADRKKDLYLDAPGGRQPANTKVLAVPQGTVVVKAPPPGDDPATDIDESTSAPAEYVVLRDRPELTGDEIEDPKQQTDQGGAPNVTFDFTDQGRQAFAEVTQRIAERGAAKPGAATACASPAGGDQFADSFAIVLDSEIVSRPIIDFCENPTGIDGRGGAQISGSFTLTEAQDLAKFLQIGALPVDLTLISQSTVSATLGQEALDQGLRAGLVGLGLVLLFLIAYYRLLGIVAGLGLVVYAVFFYALVKLIPVTVTLPGIAGLVLTIGVAADANVVIFERIKEEARAGKSLASAIATGYRKGIATIVDANVITLITAFILFVLASAGVKGFAFTLGIGTIVSLFTAVLFTQAILGSFGRRFMRSPGALGAAGEGRRWNFDFTGASRWFFSLSGMILAIGAIAFATKQLNLGIDFESGTRITASLAEPATPDEIRGSLREAGIDGADGAEVQETTAAEGSDFGENVVQIQAKIPPDQTGDAQAALEQSFGLAGGGEGFDSQSIGPTFGEQVARSAVIAIIFSLLVISAYVAIRFEAKYAIPVLIALVHDVLITAGVYALVGREVSSATVAAFLTILGYSMYDTIIVLDRIRENVPRMPRAAFSQIVNRSMSEVLTRSLITGLSTVFLIAVLLVFGGETLQDFAFAMMVGVASGTYSSIFIASPVLTAWKEREPAYRSRRARIMEAMGLVPTFPEDNVVARIDEAERHLVAAPAGAGAPARPAEPPPLAGDGSVPLSQDPVERSAPAGPGADASTGAARDSEGAERPLSSTEAQGRGSEGAEKRAERQRRRRRQGRRKHGRNR